LEDVGLEGGEEEEVVVLDYVPSFIRRERDVLGEEGGREGGREGGWGGVCEEGEEGREGRV